MLQYDTISYNNTTYSIIIRHKKSNNTQDTCIGSILITSFFFFYLSISVCLHPSLTIITPDSDSAFMFSAFGPRTIDATVAVAGLTRFYNIIAL